MEDKVDPSFSVELNEGVEFLKLCRICLQDGDLLSLHDKYESELTYAQKILQVININLRRKDANLPQQICSSCVKDLEAGYRFKMNCESSEAILQSYTLPVSVQSNETSNEGSEEEQEVEQELPVDEFYNYKSEIYDGEIIMEGENLDKDLEDVLNKSHHETLELIETKPIKTKKDSTKEKSSRSKKSFQNEKEKEHGEKIHICEICANQYKYRHALEVHMRRHRGDKPFACEFCSRSFVIRFELKRHMRVHTGLKPYACRYCERKFSDFGSRIKHERSHTGERPYICQTCGKSFAYSHVLSGHMLTHTGEKRHQCIQCGKRFTKSHHLKSHMNTHLKALNKQQSMQETPMEIKSEELMNMNVVYM